MATETEALAISALRRRALASGEPIGEGEALAVMEDHFKEVWSAHWMETSESVAEPPGGAAPDGRSGPRSSASPPRQKVVPIAPALP